MAARKHEKRKSSVRGAQSHRPAFLSDGDKGTRLQKFLANAGVDSRRNVEDYIRTGRITVDGEVVTNPAVSVKPEVQDVRLDGERLKLPKFRYYLLNKPKGVVCTNRDPAGRTRAVDLVPNDRGDKLFTVGRLDENTEGLLLVTNDGALAEHLAHPRYEVIRRYRAQVAGVPEAETMSDLRKGMHFSDGFFHFHSIRMMKRKGRSAFLELEMQEGKNREIRRLLARVGHKVIHLERISFGPIRLGRLETGACRELRSSELSELYEFIRTPPAKRKRGPKRKAAKPSKKRAAEAKKKAEPQKSRRGAARNETGRPKAAKKKPSGVRKGKSKRR